MNAPLPIEKRNVTKGRREKIIDAQGGVCKRAHCDAPATDVDHILPLWCGGTNKDTNLEGLCNPCHKRKTKAEASARARAKRRNRKHAGVSLRVSKPIPSRPFPEGQRKIPSRPFQKREKPQ